MHATIKVHRVFSAVPRFMSSIPLPKTDYIRRKRKLLRNEKSHDLGIGRGSRETIVVVPTILS